MSRRTVFVLFTSILRHVQCRGAGARGMELRAQRWRDCVVRLRQPAVAAPAGGLRYNLDACASPLQYLRWGSHLCMDQDFLSLTNWWTLYLCAEFKVGFVHIYKAAGTTVYIALHAFCGKSLLPCANFKGEEQNPGCAEALSELTSYSLFTFVRNPAERFASSVFELARRGRLLKHLDLYLGAERAANLSGSELLRTVLRTAVVPAPLDPHLQQQTAYVLHRGAVLPNLMYVGLVENIVDELPELMRVLFGPRLGEGLDEAGLDLILLGFRDALRSGGVMHERSRQGNASVPAFSYQRGNEGYSEGTWSRELLDKFDLTPAAFDWELREAVLDAYRADYICLGYAPEKLFGWQTK